LASVSGFDGWEAFEQKVAAATNGKPNATNFKQRCAQAILPCVFVVSSAFLM
jgi:hypothetical protein